MTRLTAALVLAAATAAAEARQAGPLEVTAVRYWSLADTTRVAIEITGEVHYRSDRVVNPDRIFFDFVGARPHIDGHRAFSTEVGDKLLRRIRVAETIPGVTRLVLDLEAAAEFTVSRLDNPSRLIIELRPAVAPRAPDKVMQVAVRESQQDRQESLALRREPVPMRAPPRTAKVTTQATIISEPPTLKPDVAKVAGSRISGKLVGAPPVALPGPPVAAAAAAPRGEPDEEAGDASRIPSRPIVPKAAHVSSDGERSLTRALGLKINRVVIDPGHGGSDQGTVGRRGLMEKELVLDVAKRLGKLIEEGMGSEVIYTRMDDTFVPLHARTEIANEKKADLFLSIHANSSPHSTIGGIDVYYLNLDRKSV